MTISSVSSLIEKYEIKMSKTGDKVPVVNDVHLHSAYDPKKEARELIKRQVKNLESKREILVFGLGFGYHINALIESLEQRPSPYKIVVIEPNAKVAADAIELGYIDTNKVYICAGKSAENIYTNKDLIDFLLRKPSMFTHPPSFNLYNDYFKNLLSYKAKKDLSHVRELFQSKELQNYFVSALEEISLFEHATDLESSMREKTDFDILTLAYKNIVNKSLSLNEASK